jgi:hypothetical protein
MATWAAVAAFLAKYWRQIGTTVIVAGFAYGIEQFGEHRIQAKWDLAVSQATEKVQETKAEEAQHTVEVVTEYVDRVKIVREKGATIIKEVPKYVTKEDDARCGTIGAGFVQLWNAANEGELPAASRDPDAPAGGPEGHQAEGQPGPQ